jgi:hypothetical protein
MYHHDATFIEDLVSLPCSQEIHAVVRYGEWGAEKTTVWFEYRTGTLRVVDTVLPEGFPDINLVCMLVMQKLAETFLRHKKEEREIAKKIEESFTVPVDFTPEA